MFGIDVLGISCPRETRLSIDYTLNGHVATITINRPETRNSLDMEHFRDLAHAWAAFRDDASAWVAVITGVERDFCTGADLKKFIPELTGDLPKPDGWDAFDAIQLCCTGFRYTSRSLPR